MRYFRQTPHPTVRQLGEAPPSVECVRYGLFDSTSRLTPGNVQSPIFNSIFVFAIVVFDIHFFRSAITSSDFRRHYQRFLLLLQGSNRLLRYRVIYFCMLWYFPNYFLNIMVLSQPRNTSSFLPGLNMCNFFSISIKPTLFLINQKKFGTLVQLIITFNDPQVHFNYNFFW